MSLQNPPPTVANQLFSGQYTTIHRAEFNNVGHDLVRNFYTTIANPHKTLWDAIAGVGASHNSALQSSRGSCLSGTREGVLRDIHEWRSSENTSSPVCWLSGPTGVGKSAIALTVAKSCAKSGKLAASFFFLRSDPKRNNPSFLMLTIAHGLLTTKPSLRRIIDRKITDDPSILEATLEDQFAELIARPLLRRRWWSWKHVQQLLLSRSSQKCPYFVIIDGIDECSDSDTQLRVISLLMSAYQQSPHFPLRLLICSRSESWIREVFDVPNINIFVKHIMLDESYLPSKDIERYFLHEFSGIRTSARYSQVIFPESWPSSADIQRLVQNASGQFIYAITVMKFVKAEYSHPIAQLRIILDNSPNQIRESPFVELDNLYHIIVSANPDHEKLLCILSAILLLPGYGPSSPEFIELLLGLSAGEVDLSLRGMHSVLAIHGRGHKIEVYHTSFIDYLHDRSRSSEFFISKAQQRDFLASQWLATLSKHCKLPAKSMKSFHGFNPSIGVLYQNWADFCCSVEQPSKQLLDNLKSLNIFHLLIVASNNPFFWTELPTNAPEPRIHWPCWSSLFHSFETIFFWLQQFGNVVDPDTSKRFRDVWNHFHLQSTLQKETQRDLEHWVILNVADCKWKCSLTTHIDTSVEQVLEQMRDRPSSSPLSLFAEASPVPTIGINIKASCFQVVKKLSADLQTSAERYQKCHTIIDRAKETSEMEGIISNLLDSTLLECSGSHPSLFSTFDTISMILKKFVNRINVQPPIHSQHHLFKLLSWCKSYPQTYDHSKTLLRQQILDLFDHHPNEVYFSWLSKHLPPSWPLPPPPPFVPVPLHLPALANPASVPISAPVPTTVAYTSSGRQLPSLPATLRQFPPSTSTQRKGDFTWCELQTEQRKVLVAA